MSLSSALSGALSGLQVASRRAATVSDNVAGAGQPGYGRRTVETTPIAPGIPGMRSTVVRHEDAVALALHREAAGAAGGAGVAQAFWSDLDAALGDPDDPAGLAAALHAMEGALVDAAAQPASAERLRAVAEAVERVAGKIAGTAEAVADRRQGAEDRIVAEVAQLNEDLEAVAGLNTRIAKLGAGGAATAALEDQRSVVLSRISGAVAIEVLPRDFGAVAVISKGGQVLLDGGARPVSFEPAPQVLPHLRNGAGLNGLEVRGHPAPADGGHGHMGGGRLAALFALRDGDAVAAQDQLDGLAGELVARFSDPAAVGPLGAGEGGLFVDREAGAVPPPEPEGLAARLAINPLVASGDPSGHWRLRDGLGAAATPDPATPPGLLHGILDAFAARDPRDVPAMAADLKSAWSAQRGRADGAVARAGAAAAAAEERAAASGVDIDAEMRRLIEIEQHYAASARVMSVAGEMMDRLTRI